MPPVSLRPAILGQTRHRRARVSTSHPWDSVRDHRKTIAIFLTLGHRLDYEPPPVGPKEALRFQMLVLAACLHFEAAKQADRRNTVRGEANRILSLSRTRLGLGQTLGSVVLFRWIGFSGGVVPELPRSRLLGRGVAGCGIVRHATRRRTARTWLIRRTQP